MVGPKKWEKNLYSVLGSPLKPVFITFSIGFVLKKTIDMYSTLEICVVCWEFFRIFDISEVKISLHIEKFKMVNLGASINKEELLKSTNL